MDQLARDAAAIADRLPLVEPSAAVCQCGRPLEDGRHLVARADREVRRAGAAGGRSVSTPHTGGTDR
jgi:hypothetical protein